ncbi:beta-lactamase family protein [Aspergillus clavatus NRRL 1]|uniref:Beta-lactamase family protein n=1 Tax=Aspergillus clavatus (strain ATCC 1007 / CBS 513.65 / DSM 816 / NCTC 3887 / NRRL 1 / QM 1276 / 107) TaxID=344612 RepID=A1CMK6_ASPCL|nr:beta-lactamase family protein [Aspergillus clavatus NRRL 1]EAW08793.1 beta-lactamase family protein [Aspergillus clavatus NRRL 1]
MGLPAATISLGPIKGVGTLNRKLESRKAAGSSGGAAAEASGDELQLSDIPDDRGKAVIMLADAVVQRLAKLMFIPVEDIDISRPFSHFGLDSMSGSELIHWLSQKFGVGMSFLQLLAPSCTPKSLAGTILDTLMRSKAATAEAAAAAVTNGSAGKTNVRRATADPKPVMHSYVCSVVNKNGDQLYSLSEGTLSKESSVPVDFDAVYGMASLSKLMTTVAIMICVERGQINLDDDVAPILPDLCALPVLDGVDAEGRCLTKPRTKTITLRLLMSHQSGCGYHSSPPLARWARQNGKTNSVFDSDFEVMKTYPLLFEPGAAIARTNNTTLEDFMRANIWEPLGITSTTFHPELHEGMMDRLVTLYERTDDQGLERGDWLSRIPATHDCGGHGIWSMPCDWTCFLTMILADGIPILSPASIDEIFKPQHVASGDLQELLTGPLRASLRSTVDMDAGRVEIALGGPLYMEAIPGKRSAGTLQWAGRPNLFWWIDRAKGGLRPRRSRR